MGNFIDTHAQKELTAADFMRSGVSTVSARRGVNECVSKMQRRNVDTLIVVDDQDRYQGTVSIADIRLTGHVVKTIEPLIRCNTPTVHTGDSAKDCFDLLISSGAPLPHRPERGGKGGRHHHQDQHDLRYGGTALGVRHIGMG